MSQRGFIKLSRALLDHPLWQDKPFSRGQAWVDMLFLANWKPTFFFIRGIKVNVERGQLAYSVNALGERWGWSQGKVKRFLGALQNEEQIDVQSTKLTTLITLKNYSDYQDKRNENGEQIAQQTGEQTGTLEEGKELKELKRYTSKPSVSPCPHQQIIELYHEVLPELQTVVFSRWQGSAREKDLATRWKADKRHQDLEFWRWFFSVVRTNPHWMGDNDRGWKADLGWLLKRANFDKVIERGVDHGGRSA